MKEVKCIICGNGLGFKRHNTHLIHKYMKCKIHELHKKDNNNDGALSVFIFIIGFISSIIPLMYAFDNGLSAITVLFPHFGIVAILMFVAEILEGGLDNLNKENEKKI